MKNLHDKNSFFWLNRWQENKIGFHLNTYNRHLTDYIENNPLPAGSTIFVPLCGKSIDMIYLLDKDYKVIGVEISSIAVKSFFAENNIKYTIIRKNNFDIYSSLDGIEIYCGDFLYLNYIKFNIDLVYDRASLVALPKEMRIKYVYILTKILKCSKMLVVSVFYPKNDMAGPPFSVNNKEFTLLFKDFEIKLLKSFLLEEDSKRLNISLFAENVYYLIGKNNIYEKRK